MTKEQIFRDYSDSTFSAAEYWSVMTQAQQKLFGSFEIFRAETLRDAGIPEERIAEIMKKEAAQ